MIIMFIVCHRYMLNVVSEWNVIQRQRPLQKFCNKKCGYSKCFQFIQVRILSSLFVIYLFFLHTPDALLLCIIFWTPPSDDVLILHPFTMHLFLLSPIHLMLSLYIPLLLNHLPILSHQIPPTTFFLWLASYYISSFP